MITKNERPVFFDRDFLSSIPTFVAVLLAISLLGYMLFPPWIAAAAVVSLLIVFLCGNAIQYLDCYAKFGELHVTALDGTEHRYELFGSSQLPRHRANPESEWSTMYKGQRVVGGQITVIDQSVGEDYTLGTFLFDPIDIRDARYE